MRSSCRDGCAAAQGGAAPGRGDDRRLPLFFLPLVLLLAACGSDTPFVASPTEEVPSVLGSWGGYGSEEGRFSTPWGLALDPAAGFVYVADTFNHRVQKFTESGEFLLAWGGPGLEEGRFRHPKDVAVDEAGNVYVLDTDNHRIQKFTPDGALLGAWGGAGSGPAEFMNPAGMAIGPGSALYVADTGNRRIRKWSLSGEVLGGWPAEPGPGPGTRFRPLELAAGPTGDLYVVDSDNGRIVVYSPDGEFAFAWGGAGGHGGHEAPRAAPTHGEGSGFLMDLPTAVAVDAAGTVYVTEYEHHHRIALFSGRGTPLSVWDRLEGTGPGLSNPASVVVGGDGEILVADAGNHRVLRLLAP